MRDVRASDQEEGRYRGEKDEEGGTNLGYCVFQHREAQATPIGIGGRILAGIARGQRRHIRLSLRGATPGLRRAKAWTVWRSRRVRFCLDRREGRPDLRSARECEGVGHDADDLSLSSTHEQRTAEDIGVARETLLPQPAADQDHRVLPGRELARNEEAALRWLCPQDTEEVGSDHGPLDPLRIEPIGGQVEVGGLPSGHRFEGASGPHAWRRTGRPPRRPSGKLSLRWYSRISRSGSS